MVRSVDEAFRRYERELKRHKRLTDDIFFCVPDGGVIYMSAETYNSIIRSIHRLQGMQMALGLRRREVERILRKMNIGMTTPTVQIKK